MREILAVKTGRRIQNKPTGAARYCGFIVVFGIEPLNAWTIRGPDRQPVQRGLLAIQVPKEYFLVSNRKRPSQIGREGRLTGPAFGIRDEDGLHIYSSPRSQPCAPALATATGSRQNFPPYPAVVP